MSPPPNHLATQADRAARVNQVFSWILTGATEHDVLEAIQTAWPDTKPQPLILAALKRLKQSASIDAETVAGFCFEATRDLYRRMVEIGDLAGALKAIKQLAEIARRYGIVQQEETKTRETPSAS